MSDRATESTNWWSPLQLLCGGPHMSLPIFFYFLCCSIFLLLFLTRHYSHLCPSNSPTCPYLPTTNNNRLWPLNYLLSIIFLFSLSFFFLFLLTIQTITSHSFLSAFIFFSNQTKKVETPP